MHFPSWAENDRMDRTFAEAGTNLGWSGWRKIPFGNQDGCLHDRLVIQTIGSTPVRECDCRVLV